MRRQALFGGAAALLWQGMLGGSPAPFVSVGLGPEHAATGLQRYLVDHPLTVRSLRARTPQALVFNIERHGLHTGAFDFPQRLYLCPPCVRSSCAEEVGQHAEDARSIRALQERLRWTEDALQRLRASCGRGGLLEDAADGTHCLGRPAGSFASSRESAVTGSTNLFSLLESARRFV